MLRSLGLVAFGVVAYLFVLLVIHTVVGVATSAYYDAKNRSQK